MAEKKHRTEKDWRRALAGLAGMPPTKSLRTTLVRIEAEAEARRRLRDIEFARIRSDVLNDPAVRRMKDNIVGHYVAEEEIRRHLRGGDEDLSVERPPIRVQRSEAEKIREAVWAEHDLGEDGLGGWAS